MSGISAAFGAALDAVREAHAGEIQAVREQLSEARHERDREWERADRIAQQLADATRDLTTAEAAASEARVALDAARQQATAAQAAAEAAHHAQVEAETETAKARADVEAAHRMVEVVRETADTAIRTAAEADAERKGQGALGSAQGCMEGGIAMPAAAELRRVLRRAAWRPQFVLRGVRARLRATSRGERDSAGPVCPGWAAPTTSRRPPSMTDVAASCGGGHHPRRAKGPSSTRETNVPSRPSLSPFFADEFRGCERISRSRLSGLL